MYLALIFSFALVTFVLGDQYTDKYDNIDLDAILKNDRLLKNYVDCLLEKKKCSKDGAELKRYVPDALKTGCEKCSDKQKAAISRVIRYLSHEKSDWWNELLLKYDPDGTYRRKYQELGRRQNISV